ncbi:bifunctional diaminohydroxyphosphoribosylaminopyrimidine deaminase/5-amino-6-(5-phosphoribosylamino)uracil reductase RibD [Alcaligenes faecalis]|uniref:Riboflavin biosynthesis protein RibD n=1 Tax=Alcaligenes nematophilus TaxID=2994643 RepID=A0ABU3MW99_9BURK|nr:MULTISPECIES: bifunctional diaminohydroxyphosphoribosylaminopyrimidine deaminase/5-amino-6-(5-phosphoribosylamino)uracil reductase RibD [Alcaligenes]MDH4867942.1 bifunctional diaminohydroxyphosphoribosylaminopyrimidine deaminase/5-amino-6-(5-phosphoribosylamino)uracil reductase RibD [Bacillus cereus]EKU29276.1 riboflavin-specific deaminase [Alcaligenes sp. HPC1271]ERT54962.1 diaminohydroxyphosphoribosylaminopyrimidine deaminase [Alcaligenes sp. EGD-AK7]KGP02358.1 diaminohydroxyphosphoribosyl
MVEQEDVIWMRQALELAEKSLYISAPNPRVACLIVRDGQLLASGSTQQAGGPHAEVMALRQAKERGVSVAGATFYVTLEPCSHHGRTPPCADALIKAGAGRVVFSMYDPNPLVAGNGVSRLRQAGITVDGPLCVEQALAINAGFFARMTRGRPWLWMKMAASLDGRSALPDGRSQWITGPQARDDGHHWRARSCVVLTGIGTVHADNPLMNVRAVSTPRPPIKAVLDTHLRMDPKAALLDGTPCWVFSHRRDPELEAELADRNAQVIPMPLHEGQVDVRAVLDWMTDQQINEVHAEAGARLSGALIDAGVVDQLLMYLAPKILGQGRGVADITELAGLDDVEPFEFTDVRLLGADLRVLARQRDHWEALLRAVGGAYPPDSE